MGWLYPYGATRADILERLLKPWSDGTTVIAHSLRGSSLWTVHEKSDGTRFIVQNMIRVQGGDAGYKCVSEDMGPYDTTCPLKFLELQPTPHGEHSVAWRERVRAARREANARRKRVAAIATTAIPGTVLTLPANYKVNRFTVSGPVKPGSRSLLALGDNGRLYRLTPAVLAQAAVA